MESFTECYTRPHQLILHNHLDRNFDFRSFSSLKPYHSLTMTHTSHFYLPSSFPFFLSFASDRELRWAQTYSARKITSVVSHRQSAISNLRTSEYLFRPPNSDALADLLINSYMIRGPQFSDHLVHPPTIPIKKQSRIRHLTANTVPLVRPAPPSRNRGDVDVWAHPGYLGSLRN